MSLIGFTVGCVDLSAPTLLISNGPCNSASFALVAVSVFALVEVFDAFNCVASRAWLPPLIATQDASRMLALVFERSNQLKVGESIVELVAVFMVDLIFACDWPVGSLPNNNVFHSQTLLFGVPDAAITLGGELAVSTWS